MSQTLYRKYRSQRFAEIVGQSVTVRILRNSVDKGRLNHAYLFTGPRGTGKTSIARILAKALNCPNVKDGDACGECETCRSVAAGNAVDVIEIDAASNRGIDSIRDLREKVGYTPLQLKFKVYIIDEVHMITREGFNALLKTLEEPPSHVVFMLCTTEAHKLPATILSRCIRFDFHRLPPDELAAHLEKIAGLEGYSLNRETALLLCELAECSARDALSLLDQLLVYCEHEITPDAVRELFQLGDPALVPAVIDSAAAGDRQAVLDVWHDLTRQGADPGRFLLRCAAELKDRYLASADRRWLNALDAAWQGVNLLKFESFPALLVELTMLRISAALSTAEATPPQIQAAASPPPATSAAPATPAQKAQPAAARPEQTVPRPTPPPAAEPPASSGPVKRPWDKDKPAATPAATPAAGSANSIWARFLEDLQQHHLTTYSHLLRGVSGRLEGQRLRILFNPDERQTYGFASRDVHLAALTASAQRVIGPGAQVALELSGGGGEPVLAGGAAVVQPEPGPPLEVLQDMVDEPPHPSKSGQVNAEEMERSAADMSWDAEDEDESEPQKRPTAQDAITLFDATELDAEE